MAIEIKSVAGEVQIASETATSLDSTEISCVWRAKITMGSGLWREGSGLKGFPQK